MRSTEFAKARRPGLATPARMLLVGLCLIGLLAGCALPGSHPAHRQQFDLGPPLSPSAAPGGAPVLAFATVDAPAVLDSTAMSYRLSYQSDNQPRTYGESLWSAPPAELVTQRLTQNLDQRFFVIATDETRHAAALSVRLMQFEQVFDSAAESHGVIALRATLERADGVVVAQTTFRMSVACNSADAAGGARALADATQQAASALTSWVASQPLTAR